MAERRGTKSDGVKRRGWCAAWPTRIAATLMLLMLSRVVCAQVACRYSLTVIEAPPAGLPSPTHAYAISPNGRYVVGQFSPGALGNDRAFVYDTQTSVFRAIPQVNGSSTSHAWDVSDTGVVVGEAYGLTGAWGYMFDLNTNQFTTLLKPLNVGGRCRITGINSSNQVCGTRTIGSKGDPDHPTTAFIWSAETGYQDLGLIEGWSSEAIDIAEDGGVVVGRGFGLGAFYWDGHILTPVPGLPVAMTLRRWPLVTVDASLASRILFPKDTWKHSIIVMASCMRYLLRIQVIWDGRSKT